VLIDAGFSGRRIVSQLAGIGQSIQQVDAVFLTHDHGDHTCGLRGLAQQPHLSFFANAATQQVASRKLNHRLNWKRFRTGDTFQYKDLTVTSIRLPHDASDPVGFRFETGQGTLFDPYVRLLWLTDLGYVPGGLCDELAQADYVMLEANHDPNMLDACPKRPWVTKQRIRGRHGHLANNTALQLLRQVQRPRWKGVLLGHLSADCNCTQLVSSLFTPLLAPHGIPLHVLNPTAAEACSVGMLPC
jgi:phosphoribosyl 1,2-cyclic phosphodiesterase